MSTVPAPITLEEYCRRVVTAHGEAAWVAIAYALMTRHSVQMYTHARCMPLLWVHGPRAGGKTTLLRHVSRLCASSALTAPLDADGRALFAFNGKSNALVLIDGLPQLHTPSMRAAMSSLYHRNLHPQMEVQEKNGRWIGCTYAVTAMEPPFWSQLWSQALPVRLYRGAHHESEAARRDAWAELEEAQGLDLQIPVADVNHLGHLLSTQIDVLRGELTHEVDVLHAAMLLTAMALYTDLPAPLYADAILHAIRERRSNTPHSVTR